MQPTPTFLRVRNAGVISAVPAPEPGEVFVVFFTNTSSDTGTTGWHWTFYALGGATILGTSTERNPTWTYAAPGDYRVTLTHTGSTASADHTVTVV